MSRQIDCPTCGDPVLRTHACKGPPTRETPTPFPRKDFEQWRRQAAAEAAAQQGTQLELEVDR